MLNTGVCEQLFWETLRRKFSLELFLDEALTLDVAHLKDINQNKTIVRSQIQRLSAPRFGALWGGGWRLVCEESRLQEEAWWWREEGFGMNAVVGAGEEVWMRSSGCVVVYGGLRKLCHYPWFHQEVRFSSSLYSMYFKPACQSMLHEETNVSLSASIRQLVNSSLDFRVLDRWQC